MPSLPPLREVIRAHGLSARKGLGQHFLLDLNLTARIVRAAGDVAQGTTIEVGPGPGGLTRALLDAGAHVVAVERDDRCIPILNDIAAAYPDHLTIIRDDALKVDLPDQGTAPRRVVANLPYNIGTELVTRWLDRPDAFTSLTVMVQKEVAERLTAPPGTKSYGRLSVFAGWRWSVKKAFDVSAKAFTPPPQVDSSIVHMVPLDSPRAEADAAALARVTAAAFGQRRKMLRTSLKSLGDAEALCVQTGIDPTLRAERVSVEDFCALARAVETANQ